MSNFHYILENGTKEDWERIKKENPNKWAIITNMKYNKNKELVNFNLIAICTVEERTEYLRELFNSNIEFETVRTTSSEPMGALL